jgi:hypothetical protein
LGLFGSAGAYYSEICGFAVLGHFIAMDEEDSTSAGRLEAVGAESLGEAADFFIVGSDPVLAITAFAEFKVLSNFASVRVDGISMECVFQQQCGLRGREGSSGSVVWAASFALAPFGLARWIATRGDGGLPTGLGRSGLGVGRRGFGVWSDWGWWRHHP